MPTNCQQVDTGHHSLVAGEGSSSNSTPNGGPNLLAVAVGSQNGQSVAHGQPSSASGGCVPSMAAADVGLNPGVIHGNVNKPKPSFASLFRDNRVPDDNCALNYIPFEGEKLVLSFDDIDPVEKRLGFCLVGCIVGRKLNGYAVRELIRRWGINTKFQIHESGWISFKFVSDEDRQRILKGGPYIVFGRHLYLKEMPPCFLFRVEDMLALPTWVQIYGLPGDCWANVALSRIASIVGKPIHTDKITQSSDLSKFARVLVEVDASKDKIHEFPITLPTGIDTLIHFVYESDPKFCTTCNSLGHTFDKCTRNLKRHDDVVNDGEDKVVFDNEGGERVGARSRSRNARRRLNRRRNRGTPVGRGVGRDVLDDGGPGGADVVARDGAAVSDVGAAKVVCEEAVGVTGGISPEVAMDTLVAEGPCFDDAPTDDGDKIFVEVFEDEIENVDEGIEFEEGTSKRRRRAIKCLRTLKKDGNSGSTSSASTEFVEVDSRTLLPRRNASTILMNSALAEARRHRAAKHHR